MRTYSHKNGFEIDGNQISGRHNSELCVEKKSWIINQRDAAAQQQRESLKRRLWYIPKRPTSGEIELVWLRVRCVYVWVNVRMPVGIFCCCRCILLLMFQEGEYLLTSQPFYIVILCEAFILANEIIMMIPMMKWCSAFIDSCSTSLYDAIIQFWNIFFYNDLLLSTWCLRQVSSIPNCSRQFEMGLIKNRNTPIFWRLICFHWISRHSDSSACSVAHLKILMAML